jgi:hypothetical protein
MGGEHSAGNRPNSDRVTGERERRVARRWEFGALVLMAGVGFLAFVVALWVSLSTADCRNPLAELLAAQ